MNSSARRNVSRSMQQQLARPCLLLFPPPAQMARKDMHLSNARDTFKIAGDYQTAAEYWRIRRHETIVIQRFWRGFSARSRVWSRREEKWAREEKETEAAAEEETKKTRQRQREMQRRMNPNTVQDFEVRVQHEPATLAPFTGWYNRGVH